MLRKAVPAGQVVWHCLMAAIHACRRCGTHNPPSVILEVRQEMDWKVMGISFQALQCLWTRGDSLGGGLCYLPSRAKVLLGSNWPGQLLPWLMAVRGLSSRK